MSLLAFNSTLSRLNTGELQEICIFLANVVLFLYSNMDVALVWQLMVCFPQNNFFRTTSEMEKSVIHIP